MDRIWQWAWNRHGARYSWAICAISLPSVLLAYLCGSFNRMQAGLAERQRLQAAFGTYVDQSLAVRLLQHGDDVFSGERPEVTVMFVDVRDFTPFAEANSAEDTVARLNALFEIVVPAVVDAEWARQQVPW